MATGKALFDLIKTLSPSEKRSFTLNNKLPKKNEKDGKKVYYNEVFNVLYQLGTYDKEEILARLGDKIDKDNLRHSEEYLYEKLIDTLKTSYAKKSINIQLQDLILEAQILDERGLHLKAVAVFKKAEDLARKYHKNVFLLEILPQKAAAIVALEKKGVKQQIEAVYEMAHTTVDVLKEEMIYRHENIKLTTMFRTDNNETNVNKKLKVEDIRENIIDAGFPIEGSFFSKYYYYNILALSSRLLENYDLAVQYQNTAIELWDQHAHIKKFNLVLYMPQLANQINYSICAEKYQRAWQIVKKLKALRPSSAGEKGEYFQNVYCYEQMLYLNEDNYEASKQLAKVIQSTLKVYDKKINISRRLTLLYNTGLTFWLIGDFHKALDWFSDIPKNNRYNEHRPNIVRTVNLLQLAIFYEINNKRAIENIENKLRAVKNNKETNDFEDILIKFFGKLSKSVRSSLEEQNIFSDFKTALKELEGKQIMGYEEYCVWVDRHCKE